MAIPTWQGVYPAMLTPFRDDDTIDFDMFTHNLNAQLEAGIDGVVMGGSLGEASTLLNEEKTALLRHCKQTMLRDVPAIVTIAEQSTKAAIAVAHAAEKNGADGLMILPPMRYKADDRETVAYFRAIAAASGLPIMIYNNPYDYKIEVTLPMFEQLAAVSSIQSIKESTRDVSNVTRLKNAFGDRYKILCGVDTLALEELALGADGWVGGLVDAFPAETVAIYRLMKSGKYKEPAHTHISDGSKQPNRGRRPQDMSRLNVEEENVQRRDEPQGRQSIQVGPVALHGKCLRWILIFRASFVVPRGALESMGRR